MEVPVHILKQGAIRGAPEAKRVTPQQVDNLVCGKLQISDLFPTKQPQWSAKLQIRPRFTQERLSSPIFESST
jgi:hypothetical protein